LRPAFHRWRWLSLPSSNVLTTVHCNYVQVIEGLLDSTHLGLLHADGLSRSDGVELDYARKVGIMQADLASPPMSRLSTSSTLTATSRRSSFPSMIIGRGFSMRGAKTRR
jgi:hypothetical protein